MNAVTTPLVSTIGERCRVCYTCVRECPAKAIRIADRPGRGAPRALHRLRQLRAGLHAAGQARGLGGRGRRGAARRPRPRGGHRGPELPGRVHRPRLPAGRRDAPRAGVRLGPRGGVRRRPGGARVPPPASRATPSSSGSPRPARPSSATSSATTPTSRSALAPIVSPMIATARLLRRDTAPDAEDRLHRPVHRQEGRDGRSWPARWTRS